MNNIKQLKKQLKKLREANKEVTKPYYLFYAAEYGKINNIGIKLTDKDTYKELQKDTEEFLKWQRYILSNEEAKALIIAEQQRIMGIYNASSDTHIRFIDDIPMED